MSFSKRVEHYDSDEEECGDHYEHIYEEITPKRPNKIHQQYYSESEDGETFGIYMNSRKSFSGFPV